MCENVQQNIVQKAKLKCDSIACVIKRNMVHVKFGHVAEKIGNFHSPFTQF